MKYSNEFVLYTYIRIYSPGECEVPTTTQFAYVSGHWKKYNSKIRPNNQIKHMDLGEIYLWSANDKVRTICVS